MTTPRVVVLDDTEALANHAARWIAKEACRPLTVSLSGGSTPKAAYQRLAGLAVPWSNLRLFFGDERVVPPDDEGSNFRMVRKALLERVPIPERNVHRIPGELDPRDAADRAEAELRQAFPGQDVPVFDITLLGMGADGHTASLFPGATEAGETERLYVPVHRPDLPQPWRVSATLPVINASRHVVFLVSGPEKADVLRRVMDGDQTLPSARVAPSGELTWLVTRDLADAAGVRPTTAGR